MKIRFLCFALIALLSAACQTNELKQSESLKVGMSKSEVLEIMGSPRRNERISGKDRWTYRFFQNEKWYEKEIQFQDGVATYVGETTKPPLNAEDQDAANEKANREATEQSAQMKIEHRKSVSDFEEKQPASDDNQYVPEFKPIH